MRIIVDNNYTYQTDKKVRVGSKVIVPTPGWLKYVLGPTWEGTVTDLTSEYTGECIHIIKVKKY